MRLAPVDYAIIVIYFAFVLGIGFALRGRMKTSEDFFLSGRSIPGWITGLAFMSANLGALEVMGMAANSAKYGMIINHFYWLGAIPAMCFVGVFMMPFYYGSKARSVPEYLRLRYNEKTRTLNALSFATLTLRPLRHGDPVPAPPRLALLRERDRVGGGGDGLHPAGRPDFVDL